MFSEMLTTFLLIIVRLVVYVYTYATLPIYFIVQRPWITLERARLTRAQQSDQNDQYSAWKRVGKVPPIDSVIGEQTIDRLLERAAETNGNDYEICAERVGRDVDACYKWYSYGQVLERVSDIAKGLQLIGVSNNDLVLIFAETRLEWMLCAFAVFKLGASVTTLFALLGKLSIIHGINQTRVKYVITTRQQFIKLREVLPSTPSIAKIVSIDGDVSDVFDYRNVEVISLESIENNGRKSSIQLPNVSLNTRDDIAIIMFTSGTTGEPKGVIATHGNLIAFIKSVVCALWHLHVERHRHRYIAYLPLAHMSGFIIELYCYSTGFKLGYASAATLMDGAHGLTANDISDVRLLKPTLMFAVPLVLNRFRKAFDAHLRSKPKFVRLLFEFFIEYKSYWRSSGYHTHISNLILCRKARQQFGGRVLTMIVGGAPLSHETQRFSTLILDVLLMQVYGCTEVCGAPIMSSIFDLDFGHVGAPVYGCNVRLSDWEEGGYLVTDKPNSRGEIVFNGDMVSKGYDMMTEETQQAFRIDKNGDKWFFTGDIAEALPNGTFKIIDRRKHLVKLQNGEYVSLSKIEDALKSCPYVDNICVYVCSTYDFLVAIVVPNRAAVELLAKQIGLDSHYTFEELCAHKQIVSKVIEDIRLYAKMNGLSNREVPVMCTITTLQWTPDNGMLTALLKLKREVIIKTYAQDIQHMFNTAGVVHNN